MELQKKSKRGRKSNAEKGLEVRKGRKAYLTDTELEAIVKKYGSLQLAVNTLLSE